jgi:5-methyltetrahydrofolate--homocysteine methyltransferase
MPKVTCPNGTLEYGPGHPTALICDQMRVIDQPPIVLEELSAGRIDILVDLARWSYRRGADILPIMIDHPGIDEPEMAPRIARAVQREVGCPLGIDGRNPESVEAVLSALQPYRGVMWTVTADEQVLSELLPIIKRYNAVVAGMPMGRYSRHIPMTAEGRLAEAKVIVDACVGCGIPREDIVIDAVGIAAAALEPQAYQVTLDTIKAVRKELGVAVQVGAWNASHGLPDPRYMDLAYLMGAMSWGVDAAFVQPDTPGLIECVRAMDFLTERDPVGRRFLRHWRAKQARDESGETVPTPFDWSRYEKAPEV